MTQGRRIAQYEIIEELGQGGFATVYRAYDTRVQREVALKVLAGSFVEQPELVERFHQEALIAANLRHPNIVPVYDFGKSDAILYLAMALIGHGLTLRDWLEEHRPLSLNQALPLLDQLASALDHLHRQGLVHRDVKPANVLLEGEADEWHALLTDFGLVRSLEVSTTLTKSGAVLGTPAYLSPEQADPDQWGPVSRLSDVYALGVIAYEMLVGRPPFEGGLATVLHAHAYEPPPPPLELMPELGADISDVLLRGLVKPPAERYQRASELVNALRQVAEQRRRQAEQRMALEQLLDQARQARQRKEWLRVQHLCVEILQLDREHADAVVWMAEATQGLQEERAREVERRRLAQRYEEAQAALAAGDWQTAVAAFGEVVAANPDHMEAKAGLARAQDEQERAAAYAEALAQAEAENWREAVTAWLKVLEGRPDYRQGEAVVHCLKAVRGLLGYLETLAQRLQQAEEAVELHQALIEYWKKRYGE